MDELNVLGKEHSGTDYFKSCCNNILNGVARKPGVDQSTPEYPILPPLCEVWLLGLICILFSFLGWIVFVGGFGVQQRRLQSDSSGSAVRVLLAPYWCVLVAGPVSFLVSTLYSILGYHFPRVGFILGSFATLAHFLYVSLLSSPLIYSAIFIFGFSGLDIEGIILDVLPEEVSLILGDNTVSIIQTLIRLFCEYTDGGIQFVLEQLLPVVTNIQTDLDGAMKAQFSGCVISIVFIALSMVLWQFYSEKIPSNPSRLENRNLTNWK